MIFDTVPVAPLRVNCYLLGDEKEGVCALVDPGGSPKQILEMLEKSGLALTMILLTHGHYDHTGAIHDLLERFPGIPVYLHPAEITPEELMEPTLQNKRKRMYFLDPIPELRPLSDGDELHIGSIPVKVLHTPGHSAGSVTFLVEDYMICGDTLFAGSCGRWDLPGGDGDTIKSSLRRLAELEGDYKVCPGHSDLSTLETERQTNPYMRQAMGL